MLRAIVVVISTHGASSVPTVCLHQGHGGAYAPCAELGWRIASSHGQPGQDGETGADGRLLGRPSRRSSRPCMSKQCVATRRSTRPRAHGLPLPVTCMPGQERQRQTTAQQRGRHDAVQPPHDCGCCTVRQRKPHPLRTIAWPACAGLQTAGPALPLLHRAPDCQLGLPCSSTSFLLFFGRAWEGHLAAGLIARARQKATTLPYAPCPLGPIRIVDIITDALHWHSQVSAGNGSRKGQARDWGRKD